LHPYKDVNRSVATKSRVVFVVIGLSFWF
jgi:hypothetical protein